MKNQKTKSLTRMKITENIKAPTWKTMEKCEEAAHAAILEEEHGASMSPLPRVRKRKIKRKNIATPAKSAPRRKDGIGALRLQTAIARALFRFMKKVVGKSIAGEKGAKARLQSTEEDIGDITERKVGHEADRRGDAAAVKRKERARASRRRATQKAELLVGINLRDIVGNLRRRTRSIVGNEDLPVRRRIMKGTVRRTENVRRDHAGDHAGGFYFFSSRCVHVIDFRNFASSLTWVYV